MNVNIYVKFIKNDLFINVKKISILSQLFYYWD